MKDINEKIIQNNTDVGTYKMGRDYYLNNKVKHIDLEIKDLGNCAETNITSTIVESNSTEYNVETSFNNMTPFISYQCECNTHFSFYNHRSMCEHVVATLLKYLYEKEQIIKEKEMVKTNNLIKEITKNMSRTPKAKIYLDIEIKYQQDDTNEKRKTSLELKIGEDKLYVVKNMKEFFTCYNKSFDTMEFGKKFIYKQGLHCFKE